jgi:hypothetical protein
MAKEDELIALLGVVNTSNMHKKERFSVILKKKKMPETTKIEALKREFGSDCDC